MGFTPRKRFKERLNLDSRPKKTIASNRKRIVMQLEEPRSWCDLDSSTDLYASRFSGEIGNWMLDVQRRALAELLTLPSASSVLDVGGGHAQLTPFLLEAGYNVTIHGSCVAAQGRAAPFIASGRCSWSEGPLDTLPYDTASFDAVVSFRILPHVDDWRGYLRELCRVAGSAVIIDYPSAKSVNIVSGALYQLKLMIEKTTRPYRLFWDSEVRDVLKDAGFSTTQEVRQYVLPMAAHRALGRRQVSEQCEALARRLGATARVGSPVVVRGDRTGGV
jgi:ubiquinone/menaquinone biosynthesis C-methylase UbiE